MSLQSFRVTGAKGLQLAECAAVPRLMIICGPNGGGKSTLLTALKQRNGVQFDKDTDILYQAPHRAIRRQTVQRRWLGGAVQTFSSLLSLDSIGGFEGLQISYPQRTQDNVDESGSTIKYILGKLENKRQSYIASRYDAAKAAGQEHLDLEPGAGIFEPLGDIVSRLLPHLQFTRIDFTNEDNIGCIFTRSAGGTIVEIDLDDFSSGEKSVIQLFLPLVESEIQSRLDRFKSDEQAAGPAQKDRVFLLDEPELHLHPDLQRRVLAYTRELVAGGSIQFVITTHSPTLLDEAGDDELYIMRLQGGAEVNQLRRVASAGERLTALRELTGETYFVATGRNIVCLEGQSKRDGSDASSDVSIIEVLNPRSSRYTFLPMGSKTQVAATVKRLGAGLPPVQYGVAVVGLVDGDRTAETSDQVVSWPVCEFENLLLRPEALSQVAGELGALTNPSPADVEASLETIATSRREEEIRLRVSAALPTIVFRPAGTTVEEIRAKFDEELRKHGARLDPELLTKLIGAAEVEVDEILAKHTYSQRFKGKELLRSIFGEMQLANVSYEQFCYALARTCKSDKDVVALVSEVFGALDGLVDKQLASALLAPEPAVAEATASAS